MKELLPLGESKRNEAGALLLETASQIDKVVSTDKDDEDLSDIDPWIIQYGANLRASSDLGARKKREEALQNILTPIVGQ